MISREQGALRNSSWKLPLNASTSAWAIRAHMLFPVSGGRSVLIGGRPCQLVFVSDRYGFWATKLERSHRKWCPDLCRDSFFCGCQDATSFYKRRYRNRAPASILRYGLVAANLRIAHSNSFEVLYRRPRWMEMGDRKCNRASSRQCQFPVGTAFTQRDLGRV